jgi:hypothetical protein
MSFSPLHCSKSVMEEDEMEDAPLLSLLAEGCEGSQLANSGTVSGGTGDAAPGLESCAGCGLLMNHDYYCVGCGKSIHWFCLEGDTAANEEFGHGGHYWCKGCYGAKEAPPLPGNVAAFKPISELDPRDVLHASSLRQVAISAAHQNRGSLSKKLIFSRPTLEHITFSEDVMDVTGLEGTGVARGGDVQSTYQTMSHAKGLAEKEKVGVVGKGKTTQSKRAATSTAKSTAKKGSTKLTVAKGGKRNSKNTTVDQRDNQPSGSSCKMPAALSVQDKWLCYEEVAHHRLEFDLQSSWLDTNLGTRLQKYISNVKIRFASKLQANQLELMETNIFSLLVGPTLDHLMQLTCESVNSARLAPLGAHEFRHFIGTLFLSSSFNLCVKDMFSVMDTLTGGEAMNLPRFKEILRHLRGTDPLFRDGSTGQWNDQRNLLGQMHGYVFYKKCLPQLCWQ